MQDPSLVGKIDIKAAIDLMVHYQNQQAKLGKGDAVFGKDSNPPVKRFEMGEDNCCDILHEARWERLPISELKTYWKNVPTKRAHTYRRLPLEHHGAAGAVSECVIVRAHDRSLPLKINMFSKSNCMKKSVTASETKEAGESWENPKAGLEIMEALLNFSAVYFCIWHMDPTPQLLLRLLVHYNFGVGDDRNERERCQLMIEVIDNILRENSNRAVGGEPPLSFRACKERWKDAAEQRHGSGSSGTNSNRRDNDKPTGSNTTTSGGKDSRYRTQDGRGSTNRFSGRAGNQDRRRVLQFNGKPVCFKYNRATGCDRPRRAGGCDDGRNGIFAHVCNYEDGNGKPCFQQHCRETWRH
jgi:hypothetical protein